MTIFMQTLQLMGQGMAAIFIVILVIYITVQALFLATYKK